MKNIRSWGIDNNLGFGQNILGFPRVVSIAIIIATYNNFDIITGQKRGNIQVLSYWERIMMLTGLHILIVQHFVGVHFIQKSVQIGLKQIVLRESRESRAIKLYSSNRSTNLSLRILSFLSSRLSSPSALLIALNLLIDILSDHSNPG